MHIIFQYIYQKSLFIPQLQKFDEAARHLKRSIATYQTNGDGIGEVRALTRLHWRRPCRDKYACPKVGGRVGTGQGIPWQAQHSRRNQTSKRFVCCCELCIYTLAIAFRHAHPTYVYVWAQFQRSLKLAAEVSAPAQIVERAQALLARSHAVQRSLAEITTIKQRLLSQSDREGILLSLHAIAQGNHLYELELEFAKQLLKELNDERVGDVALANDRIGLAQGNLHRYPAAEHAHANAKHLHQTVTSEMCSVLYEVLAAERKLWLEVSINRNSHVLNAAMQLPDLTHQITALRVAVGKLKACNEPAATGALELIMPELVRLLQLQGRWATAERTETELTDLRARVAQPDNSLLHVESELGDAPSAEQEEVPLSATKARDPVLIDVSGADDVGTAQSSPSPDLPASAGLK